MAPSCRILQPWELELNDGVAIGAQVELYNYARVKIGRMSLVSQYSYLCTGTHDYSDRHMRLTWAPITVGAECWIAAIPSPKRKIPGPAVCGNASTDDP